MVSANTFVFFSKLRTSTRYIQQQDSILVCLHALSSGAVIFEGHATFHGHNSNTQRQAATSKKVLYGIVASQ